MSANTNPKSGAISEAHGEAGVTGRPLAPFSVAIHDAGLAFYKATASHMKAGSKMWESFQSLLELTATEAETAIKDGRKMLSETLEQQKDAEAAKATLASFAQYASTIRAAHRAGIKPEDNEGRNTFYKRAVEVNRRAEAAVTAAKVEGKTLDKATATEAVKEAIAEAKKAEADTGKSRAAIMKAIMAQLQGRTVAELETLLKWLEHDAAKTQAKADVAKAA